MLSVQNITYTIGGLTLFDNASVHIPAGHKVGLLGRNGSGKTTLLRLILGMHELDAGSIQVRAKCRVQMVDQEAPGGSQTALDTVLAADETRVELLKEADIAEDPSRIAEIHTKLVDIDAHSAPSRAAYILSGLGFDEEAQKRPLSTFSGGYRMRVALAAVLFIKPDLLLLDEPSNHLDLESSLWLENHLKNYSNTLLMVSHDRSFLEEAVDHILHLKNRKLEIFKGGFDKFEQSVQTRQEQDQAQRERQEADRKRIQAFVDRFRAKPNKARQAQSRLKLLERMVPIAIASEEPQFRFHFPTSLDVSSPLIRLDNAVVGYLPDKPVLKDLHLTVFKSDRIALLGANGNGKTTLSKLLSNELAPQSGSMFTASKLKVGYFAQDHLEKLAPKLTALAQMSFHMQGDSPTAVRGWLGRFGLSQEKVNVTVEGLSGGEKTRLALAIMAVQKPNLLVLDEPTNHLDMDSRKGLISALSEYEGAIVLVSHDRHLIEATADQLWLVAGGTAQVFFGDLDEYRDSILTEAKNLRSANREEKTKNSGDIKGKKEDRRDKAARRLILAPFKKAAEEAEMALERLTMEKDEINAALSNPSTYTNSKEQIAALTRRQRELATQISEAEDKWLKAEADLEMVMKSNDGD